MARTLGSSDSRFFGSRFGVLVWRCWFSVFLLKGEHGFVYLLVWYWLTSSSVYLLLLLPWIRPLNCRRLLCLSVFCFVYCPDVCLFATAWVRLFCSFASAFLSVFCPVLQNLSNLNIWLKFMRSTSAICTSLFSRDWINSFIEEVFKGSKVPPKLFK